MTRRRLRRALGVALLAAWAAPLPAQEFGETVALITPEEMRDFSECRAAIFYHLDGAEDPEAVVTRPATRMLLDQINFIMAETIAGRPALDVAEQRSKIDFVERFFIDFNRTLAETRERFADLRARERALMTCMPWVWASLRGRFDELIRWRRHASDPPPAPSAEETRRAHAEVARRLGVEE